MAWRLAALHVIGAYLRQVPEHAGRWRLIAPAVALAPALRTTAKSWVIPVREGFRMEVDGSSQTGRMLYATGEYESETTRIIKHLLEPGDTMIDVGANIGYFAVLAAKCVGPAGCVMAFEPMAPVRARLQRNLDINHLANVTVRDIALADQSGTVTFFAGPPDDSGLASLRRLDASTEVQVVQARFDDLWQADRPVALIKMDVEGAELAALRGMAGCLSRHEPDVVVEVTDQYLRVLGASAAALVAFLTDQGYSMFRIDNAGIVPIDGVRELDACPSQFNALFTKRPHRLPRTASRSS